MLAALSVYLITAASLASAQTGQATPAQLLARAKTWGYQLQHVDPAKLAAAPHDVLVIDYSRDGSDAAALSRADLDLLKRKPDGSRRIVLSYLSIGEAEEYRFYWKSYWGWLWGLFAPSWRSGHNSEWHGNYAVRYWSEGWQRIILGPGDSYLDRILNAGFDGVWLDKIDSSQETVAKGRASARDDMIAFVRRIGERGRAASPGFLVVPQNGDDLLTDSRYRATIDGIGQEDLLFGEDKDKVANNPVHTEQRIAHLKLLTAEGKPVLAVEYIDDPEQIVAARRRLEALGFVPHFAPRALDRLRMTDLPVAP